MPLTKWDKFNLFDLSAFAILASTSAAKIATLLTRSRLLESSDYLLGLSNKVLLGPVAALEFGLAVLLLFSRSWQAKYLCLAWFSTILLIYKGLAVMLSVPKPCPCLGSLVDWIGVKPEFVEPTLAVAAVYLLVGSIYKLWGCASARRPVKEAPVM